MTERRISPIPKEARTYQGHRAGIVTRLTAASLDGIVVGILLIMAYLGWAGMEFLLDPLNFTFPQTNLLLSLSTGLFLAVFYLAASWRLTGRSYGCHVMGLRVVSWRGRRMAALGALLRAGFCVFFPIGLLYCVVNKENRSVQDIVLRTSVIYDWEPRQR